MLRFGAGLRTAASIGAALGAFWAEASAAETSTVVFLREAETKTVLSGRSGDRVELRVKHPSSGDVLDSQAVQSIRWEEQGDKPCYVEQTARAFDGSGAGYASFAKRCDGKSPGSPKSVAFSGRTYVAGLRVCLDGDGERIKGVQLKGRVVSADGAVTDANAQPREERTNCREWKAWVACPAGQVASGLIVAFDKARGPKSAYGLGLICRAVATRRVHEPVAMFEGAPSMTPIAGLDEVKIDLTPTYGGYDHRLSSFAWQENDDEPCSVEIKGESLGRSPSRADAGYATCVFEGRAASRREVSSGSYGITALRVCLSGTKVKGVGLKAASIVLRPDRVELDAIEQDLSGFEAEQPNCGKKEWTPYVRCPAGQIAVGVQLRFLHLASKARFVASGSSAAPSLFRHEAV